MTNKKLKLPDYLDCINNTEPCDWYLHKACKDTCHYALYQMGFVGGLTELPPALGDYLEGKLEEEVGE